MRDWLELLLIASLSGSVLGLGVLLLRKLCWKRAGPSFWYYLWVLVALRLLLPLEAPVTAFTIPTSAATTGATSTMEPAWEPSETIPSESPARPVQQREPGTASPPDDPDPAHAARSFRPPQLSTVLFLLWLTVAVSKLLAGVIGTIRFTKAVDAATKHVEPSLRLMRLATEAAGQVGLSSPPLVRALPGIGIPLQAGLCKPVVLLPDEDKTDNELRYILLHELTHYRRRDILYKWLVHLMACLHWFNPLAYLFRREIAKDCELSCDARVLRLLDDGEHLAYGDMLLAFAAKTSQQRLPAGSVMLSEDAGTLKSRLSQIAGYGKRAKPLAALSVAMVVVLLACGFVAGPSREKEAAPVIPARSRLQQLLGLNDPADIAKDFALYAPYGLTHNLQYNRLYFDGQLVRYFEDIESDTSYKRWAMPDGAVDVYADRDADGALVGVKRYSQAEFDARTGSIDQYPHAYTHSVSIYRSGSGQASTGRDTPSPEALGQRLPGETDGEYYGRVYGEYYSRMYGSSDPPDSLKETLAAVYEEYRPYGLTYQPDDHRLYYGGRLVKFFSDLPDGGAGTSNNRYFGPYADGEVTVTAQRNQVGTLTGLDVKPAEPEDGAGIDWQDFSSQGEADRLPSPQAAGLSANRGSMTASMPIAGTKHIQIVAPTCQLVVEKSSGDTIEAVFSYPLELEPNYSNYVDLVIEQPAAATALVETRYDDHGFDPVPGMDMEEQMGYQPVLTVRIPDRQYESLTLRIVATARDDVWDLPLDIRADTLDIRSVANNLRIITGVDYGKVRIDHSAGELYFVTRQVGKELAIKNRVASLYLTLLEEPRNITFDLSEVDGADIPEHWRGSLVNDRYTAGAGDSTATVENDMGTVRITVQR